MPKGQPDCILISPCRTKGRQGELILSQMVVDRTGATLFPVANLSPDFLRVYHAFKLLEALEVVTVNSHPTMKISTKMSVSNC